MATVNDAQTNLKLQFGATGATDWLKSPAGGEIGDMADTSRSYVDPNVGSTCALLNVRTPSGVQFSSVA